MGLIRLKYVHRFRDRHGKLRHYFRRASFKRVPLPGVPGSAEFMEAYQAAAVGAPRIEVVAKRPTPGSVAAVVMSYLGSPAFHVLAADTRTVRRNMLERFAVEHGNKRVALLQREHVQRIMDGKAKTPGAARNFLSALRVLMQFAIAVGISADDPTIGIKRPKLKRSGGWHTWTEDEIEAYRTKHSIGSMARLALELTLYTAQRRSDVIRMGRQHLRNGNLEVRQQKTGATLAIPVHPDLQAAIEAMPSSHLTFLTMSNGKPFTPAGFTQWFRARCGEAGLRKGASAHGLRKATCRRLAEAGCSANVIAAISGHNSLREIERYTKQADQAQMAKRGINALPGGVSLNETRTSRGKP